MCWAASSSALFLSFLPSVKILLRATDEVLSAAFDHSDDLVCRGLRPFPFLVYSGAMSVAYQFAFDDNDLSLLLSGAGSYVAFLIVSYAVLLKFGADLYAVAVAAGPNVVHAAARVPGLGASAVRSLRAILAVKSRRYVAFLELLLLTVPLFAVNQVVLGASKLRQMMAGRNNKDKKRVTLNESAQVVAVCGEARRLPALLGLGVRRGEGGPLGRARAAQGGRAAMPIAPGRAVRPHRAGFGDRLGRAGAGGALALAGAGRRRPSRGRSARQGGPTSKSFCCRSRFASRSAVLSWVATTAMMMVIIWM
jgi:hypothetical protein